MFERIPFPGAVELSGRTAVARGHLLLQRLVAWGGLLGIAFLCTVVLSKRFFLGSDSAHHYAHIWFISEQIFHHARLPLHIPYLESGKAVTFPYGVVPYLVTAIPYAVLGDWAVTASLIAGVAFYGYAAVRARPVLRDPRLLALIYVNTFLIEGIVSFQFAFIWSCGFFLLTVEAIDKRRWALAGAMALVTVTTHPVAGAIAVPAYTLFAVLRRPRDFLPLGVAMGVAALLSVPYVLYAHTTPAVSSTPTSYIIGTIRYMARFRGTIVVMPLIVAALAPLLRPLFLPAFAAMALTFTVRFEQNHVNTYGLKHDSSPFYADFIKSPLFDRSLTYRVLEPNDREDGAYQLIKNGAILGQEFFEQSEFHRWWYSLNMYSCYLGAKNIDVVLDETEYKYKFNQNEEWPLGEFVKQGKAQIIYTDPKGRFTAYDVRGAQTPGAQLSQCGF
ncbi:MAG: hypothetical protein ABSC13_04690 [Dehalococcoidia bacterium]|jgi:hypothetical protein